LLWFYKSYSVKL